MLFKMSVWLVAAAVVSGQRVPASGIDRTNLDPTCKPCTDFWRYANGAWMDRNPIPARFARWGTTAIMGECDRERLRALLEAAEKRQPRRGSIERKLGDYYASCMDTATIETRGIEPLQPALDLISAVHSVKDLAAVLNDFQRTVRGAFRPIALGPFALMALPDLKNSKEIIAVIFEGGLSLPDRDYYLKVEPRSQEIREQFAKHVVQSRRISIGTHSCASSELLNIHRLS
jgi:putative endopeptidase